MLRRGAATAALVFGLTAGLGAGPRVQEPEGNDGTQAAIDPEAAAIMRRARAFLGGVEQFTVLAEAWYDVLLDDETTIQYEATVELAVRRPDRLNIDVRGDVEDRELWYDGESISVLHRTPGLYATTDARATIDATLEHIDTTYELTFPLQDLALSGPNTKRRDSVQRATYLGLHTAGGVSCHHLLWIEPEVDVQVWIEAGERPLPRRIVIDHKNLPGSPRYNVTLANWDLSASLADEVFSFTPPVGSEEIPLVEVQGRPR